MTAVLAICVAITFGVSVFLLLSRELKGIAMGVFLIGHAANLSIIAMSRSPVIGSGDVALAEAADGVELTEGLLKSPPVLPTRDPIAQPLAQMVDPLPQALILTAIVIGFGVMGFLLALIVMTGRTTGTLETDQLGDEDRLPIHEAL